MTIQEFVANYPIPSRPIEAIVRRWVAEKEVRDFLGATVIAGVTVADLMTGDRLVDTLSPDVKGAFRNLMGPGADTREEIERLILEKIELGDASVLGLINKIQGQLGEDTFVRLVGSAAQLAASKSQEGWDVRVGHAEPFKYVQVKVYEDPTGLSDHLEGLKREAGARGDSRWARCSLSPQHRGAFRYTRRGQGKSLRVGVSRGDSRSSRHARRTPRSASGVYRECAGGFRALFRGAARRCCSTWHHARRNERLPSIQGSEGSPGCCRGYSVQLRYFGRRHHCGQHRGPGSWIRSPDPRPSGCSGNCLNPSWRLPFTWDQYEHTLPSQATCRPSIRGPSSCRGQR